MPPKDTEEVVDPAKTQAIKEEFEKTKSSTSDSYNLPKLEITEADRDQYALCLGTGAPFQQRFSKPEFKFSVTLRDKTKREGDIISRQLDLAANQGKILSMAEYTNSYNLACLYYQLDEINQVPQHRQYPKDIYDMKDFNLQVIIDNHSALGNMTSSQIYLMIGWMTQLNQKLMEISREAFSPSFS